VRARVKYIYKTQPRPHQSRSLRFLLRRGGGGLQVPMRYGKTKVVIDFIACVCLKKDIDRALVVCPLTVVDVWAEQVRVHCPIPATVINVDGEVLSKAEPVPEYADRAPITIMVVNYHRTWDRYPLGTPCACAHTPEQHKSEYGPCLVEKCSCKGKPRQWINGPQETIDDYAAEIVAVDEAHNLGDPSTATTKYVAKYGDMAMHRVFVTGTLFHRRPFLVFGPFMFYDKSVFGTAYESFKGQYAVFGGFGGYEVIKYINLKSLMAKVRKHVLIEEAKDFTSPPVEQVLHYELTGQTARYYRKMLTTGFVKTDDGKFIESAIVLDAITKCSQIATGWVKSDEGELLHLGEDKYSMGLARMHEYADQGKTRVVVGCRFLPELKDAKRAAAKAGYATAVVWGESKPAYRTKALQWFAQDDARPKMLICQVQAVAEGVDMSSADTMLFWGLPDSFVTFDQFRNRIVKYSDFEKGSGRHLGYDFLIGKNTWDELKFMSLMHKQDVADYIDTNPELVEALSQQFYISTKERKKAMR
jgi:SNF2-related domain